MSCATTGQTEQSKSGAAIGAAAGALTGYLIGKKRGSNEALAGALIGAIVGGTIGWSVGKYVENKTKSAEQVKSQYAKYYNTNSKRPPAVESMSVYTDSPVAKPGTPLKLYTSYDILVPDSTSELRVTEKRVVKDSNGKVLMPEQVNEKTLSGAGGYESYLPINVPENAQEGDYVYDASVSVGNNVKTGETKLHIAKNMDGEMIVCVVK